MQPSNGWLSFTEVHFFWEGSSGAPPSTCFHDDQKLWRCGLRLALLAMKARSCLCLGSFAMCGVETEGLEALCLKWDYKREGLEALGLKWDYCAWLGTSCPLDRAGESLLSCDCVGVDLGVWVCEACIAGQDLAYVDFLGWELYQSQVIIYVQHSYSTMQITPTKSPPWTHTHSSGSMLLAVGVFNQDLRDWGL